MSENKTNLQDLIILFAKNKQEMKQYVRQTYKTTQEKIKQVNSTDKLSSKGKREEVAKVKEKNADDIILTLGERMKEANELRTQIEKQAYEVASSTLQGAQQLDENDPKTVLFLNELESANFKSKVTGDERKKLQSFRELFDKYGDDPARANKIKSSLMDNVSMFKGSEAEPDMIRLYDAIEHETKNGNDETKLAFELVGENQIELLDVDIDRSEVATSDINLINQIVDRKNAVKIVNDESYILDAYTEMTADEDDEAADATDEEMTASNELEAMMKTIGQEEIEDDSDNETSDNV